MSHNRHALALFEGTVDSRYPLIKLSEPPPPQKTVHCEHLPSPGSAVWAHGSLGQASTSRCPHTLNTPEAGVWASDVEEGLCTRWGERVEAAHDQCPCPPSAAFSL